MTHNLSNASLNIHHLIVINIHSKHKTSKPVPIAYKEFWMKNIYLSGNKNNPYPIAYYQSSNLKLCLPDSCIHEIWSATYNRNNLHFKLFYILIYKNNYHL